MRALGRVFVIEEVSSVRQEVCRGLGEAGYVLLAATAERDVGSMIDTFAPDVIVARLAGSPAERVPQLQRGIEIPVILLASDDAPLGERVASSEGRGRQRLRRTNSHRRGGRPGRHLDGTSSDAPGPDRVHDVTIDLDAHVVRRNDVELQLAATEFNLLLDLVTNVGMVLSKRQLLERVWGFDEYDVNVVEAHVSALRRKLEAVGPRLIHTVRGFGYVLRPPPPAEHSHN